MYDYNDRADNASKNFPLTSTLISTTTESNKSLN